MWLNRDTCNPAWWTYFVKQNACTNLLEAMQVERNTHGQFAWSNASGPKHFWSCLMNNKHWSIHERSRDCTDIRAILFDELTLLNKKHGPIHLRKCKWTGTLMVLLDETQFVKHKAFKNLLKAMQRDRNTYDQFAWSNASGPKHLWWIRLKKCKQTETLMVLLDETQFVKHKVQKFAKSNPTGAKHLWSIRSKQCTWTKNTYGLAWWIMSIDQYMRNHVHKPTYLQSCLMNLLCWTKSMYQFTWNNASGPKHLWSICLKQCKWTETLMVNSLEEIE
jgi:hypothetical protein